MAKDSDSSSTTTIRITNVAKTFLQNLLHSKKFATVSDALDEVTVAYQFFKDEGIPLEDFFKDHFAENNNRHPRLVYEAAHALLRYWDKTYSKNKHTFIQFIDKWNLVAYYIKAHTYSHHFQKAYHLDTHKVEMDESLAGIHYLFFDKIDEFKQIASLIMDELEPHKTDAGGVDVKARIVTLCMQNEDLVTLLSSPSIHKREKQLQEITLESIMNIEKLTRNQGAYPIKLKTYGMSNKLANLMLLSYHKPLTELPPFVDHYFIQDLFAFLHHAIYTPSMSICTNKALASCFKIIIKTLEYFGDSKLDVAYIMGFLVQKDEKLLEAFRANLVDIELTELAEHLEGRMTACKLVAEALFAEHPTIIYQSDIHKVLIDNLTNTAGHLYHFIVKQEGRLLNYKDQRISSHYITKDTNSLFRINITYHSETNIAMSDMTVHHSSQSDSEKEKGMMHDTITVNPTALQLLYFSLKETSMRRVYASERLSFFLTHPSILRISFQDTENFYHTKHIHDCFLDELIKTLEDAFNTEEMRIYLKFYELHYGSL